jgi:RNA polymerase sigma-70 factor (ECF subfamily)
MQGLLNLLTDDIVFTGDGGGKAQTGLKPVHGPDKVARGLLGGLRQVPPEAEVTIEDINAQPAIVARVAGRTWGVILLHIEAGHIRHVYAVVNPDKLRHLDL